MHHDRHLTEIEIEATYVLDEKGRFAGDQASRFALWKTREGNVSRFRDDQPDELIEEIQALVEQEPVTSDLRAGLVLQEEFERALTRWAPVEGVSRGLGYRYPEELGSYPSAIGVDRSNVHLGAETLPWLLEEVDEWQPCLAVVDDGKLVSVCQSVRISESAHVAGVQTVEGYRRRGYATAVSVQWGKAVRGLGLEPIYSTALENEASQGVARRAGLVLYNADHHFK